MNKECKCFGCTLSRRLKHNNDFKFNAQPPKWIPLINFKTLKQDLIRLN